MRTQAGTIRQSENRRLILEVQCLHMTTGEKLDTGSRNSGITQSLDEIATMHQRIWRTEAQLEPRAETESPDRIAGKRIHDLQTSRGEEF